MFEGLNSHDSAPPVRPLESFPAHRSGQQNAPQAELQPSPLGPGQLAPGRPRPDRLIQCFDVNLDERQGRGENGGGSYQGKHSFSPMPSSGKNLNIE
jgi:hypothetical protein